MEKQRSFKTMALLALVLSVFGVSVAFAAMSTVLTINGSAKLDPTGWDVHFDVNSLGVTKSDAATSVDPKIENLTISGFEITLTRPGDYVEYTFDVVNAGGIDAKIGNIDKQEKPTCTNTTGDPDNADGNLVCANIEYTLTYVSGDDITPNAEVAKDDVLSANKSAKMKLRLEYTDAATAQPSAPVDLTNLSITITYVQK